MRLAPVRGVFGRQVLRWSVRGVFCAAPSFFWALVTCGRGPDEIAGMIAGVVVYIAGYAWMTSLPDYVGRVAGRELGKALNWAANLRAALAPLFVYGPDLALGIFSLNLVKWLALEPAEAATMGEGVRGFALTFATTVVQGALVSATLGGLAAVICGVRAGWRHVRA